MKKVELNVVVEKGDKYLVGFVPELPGCHTQGETLDELMENMKEAVELYLEVSGKDALSVIPKLMGIQRLEVEIAN